MTRSRPPVAELDVVRLSEQLTTMRALRSQIVRPDPLRIERLARDGLQIALVFDDDALRLLGLGVAGS